MAAFYKEQQGKDRDESYRDEMNRQRCCILYGHKSRACISVHVYALAGPREQQESVHICLWLCFGHCCRCLHRVEKLCMLNGCPFELPPQQCHRSIQPPTHTHTLGLCNHSLRYVLLHSLHQPSCCLSYYSPNCHAYGNLSAACYPLR